MKRAARRFLALLFCATAFAGAAIFPAIASDGIVLDRPAGTDMARAWLDLLLRGIALPDSIAYDAPRLGAVAAALHRALGIYSTSILVIAALLLFYAVTVMIVETAHYGVPLGRRSAQLWVPLRLVLAVGFLVPVSGGLNSGQYLMAWMAEQGSGLASHAWEIAADNMKGAASTTLPRSPDVAGFVAGSFEAEMCRVLYQRSFAAMQPDAGLRLAGDIGDIQKLPRSRYTEETWQYSNRLHAQIPLCGAYRFAAASTLSGVALANTTVDRLSTGFGDFARADTDRLIAETRTLAENNLPVFLGQKPDAGLRKSLQILIDAHQAALDERLHAFLAGDSGLMDQALSDSADAGWITAGGFMLNLARLQATYGAIASHALPAVQTPLFTDSELIRPSLTEAIMADPSLRVLASSQGTVSLVALYVQMQHASPLMRDWLYNRQLADMPLLLANPFQLRDQLSATSDPQAVGSLFSHVLNDAAVINGVWDNGTDAANLMKNSGNPGILALPSVLQNAITGLAEFGRRQTSLGNYLVGIAAPDLAPAGTRAYAFLLAALGLAFMASGFALMFVVPLLPFFRFFLGILVWLLNVFEAIIAIPIVALAHINLNGEGLGGGAMRRVYLLWLNIITRPALTLFGLLAGLLVFTFAMIILDLAFKLLGMTIPASGSMFVTINAALTFFYTVLACAAANVAFKGITLLPEQTLKWLEGINVTIERPETPSASASATATQNMPNLSLTGTLLAQRLGLTDRHGAVAGGRHLIAATEAKARSLKAALFPAYSDGKSGDTGKTEKENMRHEKQPGFANPLLSSTPLKKKPDPRHGQKPKNRLPEKADLRDREDIPRDESADSIN